MNGAIAFSNCNDVIIEYNEFYNMGWEMGDWNVAYCGAQWWTYGNALRYNFVHHLMEAPQAYPVGAFRNDDGGSGTTFHGNVFYKVTRAAFIGGGRDCLVENNIFVDCNPALHIDARAMTWASYHVNTTMTDRLKAMPYKSELWRKRYPRLVNMLEDEPAAPKGNIIRHNVCSGGKWLELHSVDKKIVTWEDNLIDKEPGFADKANMNFQLKFGSEAYKIGFKPIPIDKMGLLVDLERLKRR